MSEDFPAGMGEYPEYSGMTAEELAAPCGSRSATGGYWTNTAKAT